MRTISGTLSAGLASAAPKYFKRILLRARTWNGSAYAWPVAEDVTAELKEISTVRWKLDTESFGVWSLANVTLAFRNDNNRWRQGRTGGHFAPGMNRLLYKSQIQVQAGTVSADGTEEPEYIFTGLIMSDPAYDPAARTATMTIVGKMALFDEVSAEDVSMTVTDECLGSDSGTAFATAYTGVGIIKAVKRGLTPDGAAGASTLRAQSDYTVTDLDDAGKAASITLTDELTSGNSLWATYVRWYQNKTIEWVVAQLCAAAGVTDTAITPAVFENSARNTFTQTDKAGFDTGAGEHTVWDSGDVGLNNNFPMPTAYSWQSMESNSIRWDLRPTFPEFYTAGERVSATSGWPAGRPNTTARWASARAASTGAYGTWQFTCDAGALYGIGTVPHYFHFVSDTGVRATTTGYCLLVDFYSPASNTLRFTLYRANAGALTALWSVTYNATRQPWGNAFGYLRFRLSRNGPAFSLRVLHGASGQWTDYGTIAQDVSITTSAYAIAAFSFPAWSGSYPIGTFQGIGHDEQVMTGSGDYYPYGEYLSPAIDGTASLVGWGALTPLESIPSGCGTGFDVRERASESETWGAWVPVTNTGAIPATKRYIQLRWRAYADAGQSATPLLQQWTVTYYTGTVTIPLVNLAGLTCRQALEELAKMTGYEIGFDTSDAFLFRPRSSGMAAVGHFDRSNIVEVQSIGTGMERHYNRVKVAFGEYSNTVDARTRGEARPDSIDRYGVRELSISSGGLLPATSVDLAYAIAPTVYAYTSKLRLRARVKTRFALNLELGDRVTVAFDDMFRLWLWGGDARYGQAGLAYYSAAYLSAGGIDCSLGMRVEGIEYDLENWQTTFDLVESL